MTPQHTQSTPHGPQSTQHHHPNNLYFFCGGLVIFVLPQILITHATVIKISQSRSVNTGFLLKCWTTFATEIWALFTGSFTSSPDTLSTCLWLGCKMCQNVTPPPHLFGAPVHILPSTGPRRLSVSRSGPLMPARKRGRARAASKQPTNAPKRAKATSSAKTSSSSKAKPMKES